MGEPEVFEWLRMKRKVQDWREPLGLAVQAIIRASGEKPLSTTDIIRRLGVDIGAEKREAKELNTRLHELKGPASPLHGYWRVSETRLTPWKDSDGVQRPAVEWIYQPDVAKGRRGAAAEAADDDDDFDPQENDPNVEYGGLEFTGLNKNGELAGYMERSDGRRVLFRWSPVTMRTAAVMGDDQDKEIIASYQAVIEVTYDMFS